MSKQITTIKSGTKTFPVYEGDYLIDNGSSLQFTAHWTNPILYREKWIDYRAVRISKKTFKAMIKAYDLKPVVGEMKTTRYYF